MTKTEALLKLRVDPAYRIVSYMDFKRLERHLGTTAMRVKVEVKDCTIDAIQHNSYFFIPCTNERLVNCYYDSKKMNGQAQ